MITMFSISIEQMSEISLLKSTKPSWTIFEGVEWEGKESSPELQESTPELQESTPELQESTVELQKSPSELQESSPELQESTPELQKSPSELQEVCPEVQEFDTSKMGSKLSPLPEFSSHLNETNK